MVKHAEYGRKELNRCVKKDYGGIPCVNDVLELLDTRCSGRRQCTVRVPLQFLAEYDFVSSCPDDLKPYLETDYTCVKGGIHVSHNTLC